jgi:phage-related protein
LPADLAHPYHDSVAWLTRTFTTDAGRKPVEEWIASLDPAARAEVLLVIDLLEEHGTALREPFAKHLEDAIWELRARGPDGIYRVLYFHWFGHTFGLLHGFTKKTRKTPRAELEIAKQRRAAWLARPGPRQ